MQRSVKVAMCRACVSDWRAAEAAEISVETCCQLGARGGERRGRQANVRRSGRRDECLEGLHQKRVLRAQLTLVGAVIVGHAREHVLEGGHAVARLLREVGAGEERALVVVSEEHRQRPAARAACEQLLRDLIDAVDVGALLTVHLDVHEALVQQARGGLVLEALVCKHVAPVACGVADAQVHGLVLTQRDSEGLRTPWVPVHGVVRMLYQIGARLARQAILGAHLLYFPLQPTRPSLT
jgi:hypothetical protein